MCQCFSKFSPNTLHVNDAVPHLRAQYAHRHPVLAWENFNILRVQNVSNVRGLFSNVVFQNFWPKKRPALRKTTHLSSPSQVQLTSPSKTEKPKKMRKNTDTQKTKTSAPGSAPRRAWRTRAPGRCGSHRSCLYLRGKEPPEKPSKRGGTHSKTWMWRPKT